MIIAMIKTQMNSNVQIAIANSNVHSNVQNSNETTSHEWFHCKVLNILTSLLWSIRVQTIGKLLSICFFTITLTVLKL